jgi:diaminopropionate ammonia-lyase
MSTRTTARRSIAVIVVVEPEAAPCVAVALAADRPIRVTGTLETAAEMLSCGEASAPALAMLQRNGARIVTVSETALVEAPRLLLEAGGPATTPSGAAGLAGATAALTDKALAARFDLRPESRVLLLATEAALDD